MNQQLWSLEMPTESYSVRMIYIQIFAFIMLFKKWNVPIAYVGIFPPHAKLLKKCIYKKQ